MTLKLHFQINFYTIIQKWIKKQHPPLDDLQACSESSKSGLYKTSTFGWFASMLRIIQKWIVQNIQFWMT